MSKFPLPRSSDLLKSTRSGSGGEKDKSRHHGGGGGGGVGAGGGSKCCKITPCNDSFPVDVTGGTLSICWAGGPDCDPVPLYGQCEIENVPSTVLCVDALKSRPPAVPKKTVRCLYSAQPYITGEGSEVELPVYFGSHVPLLAAPQGQVARIKSFAHRRNIVNNGAAVAAHFGTTSFYAQSAVDDPFLGFQSVSQSGATPAVESDFVGLPAGSTCILPADTNKRTFIYTYDTTSAYGDLFTLQPLDTFVCSYEIGNPINSDLYATGMDDVANLLLLDVETKASLEPASCNVTSSSEPILYVVNLEITVGNCAEDPVQVDGQFMIVDQHYQQVAGNEFYVVTITTDGVDYSSDPLPPTPLGTSIYTFFVNIGAPATEPCTVRITAAATNAVVFQSKETFTLCVAGP